MGVVKGRESIKEAYRDEARAAEYTRDRFEHPFGAALHERQVACVNREISRLRPQRLLELACGPARLTADIVPVPAAVAVEQSPAMLAHATARLREAGLTHWTLMEGDAFALDLPAGSFDVAITFRFIRHFGVQDRALLFEQVRRVLVPSGRLIFDVSNRDACTWLWQKWGVKGSWVDDYMFTRREFVDEMAREGFVVEAMHPVHAPVQLQYAVFSRIHGRAPRLAARLSRAMTTGLRWNPYEWVVVCRRA